MTGFGRRDIEDMQALCIYNIYIECYSLFLSLNRKCYAVCAGMVSTKDRRFQKEKLKILNVDEREAIYESVNFPFEKQGD